MEHYFSKIDFLPSETEAIMKISLYICRGADAVVWSYTRNDLFSVKSTYHVIMNYRVVEGLELVAMTPVLLYFEKLFRIYISQISLRFSFNELA